jgi:hypothetical protein
MASNYAIRDSRRVSYTPVSLHRRLERFLPCPSVQPSRTSSGHAISSPTLPSSSTLLTAIVVCACFLDVEHDENGLGEEHGIELDFDSPGGIR